MSSGDSVASSESEPSESLLRILGMQGREKCGYCGTESGSRFFALRAHTLQCKDYQILVDRGWRRSGSLLYLTDLSSSCCPYYTIRTRALEFQPTSKDKKLVRRWRKYLGSEEEPRVRSDGTMGWGGTKHSLEVRLESAEFSEQKYRVFKRYQETVHNDTETSRKGFRKFLCDSPLVPLGALGSFHQCYYVDGRLVAVGVVDVLPQCVSSVYLFYDPEISHLSIGSYTAMRELAFARQLHDSGVVPELEYYYMGYYIPTCPKMTYKKHWRPAELLDLTTFKWIPIEQCLDKIARHPYFCCFDPDLPAEVSDKLVRDSVGEKLEVAPVFGVELVEDPGNALEFMVLVEVSEERFVPIAAKQLVDVYEQAKDELLHTVAGLGNDLAHRALLLL